MRRTGACKVFKAMLGIKATPPTRLIRRGSLITTLARPLPLRLTRLLSMATVPPRNVRYTSF